MKLDIDFTDEEFQALAQMAFRFCKAAAITKIAEIKASDARAKLPGIRASDIVNAEDFAKTYKMCNKIVIVGIKEGVYLRALDSLSPSKFVEDKK